MLIQKIAAMLAIIIGIMAIRVSTKALRGWQPGWKVFLWLPMYNLVMGILSLIPAILLWMHHPYALTASLVIFATHTVIFVLLLSIFRAKVARQSVRAMAFCVATWLVILVLFWI